MYGVAHTSKLDDMVADSAMTSHVDAFLSVHYHYPESGCHHLVFATKELATQEQASIAAEDQTAAIALKVQYSNQLLKQKQSIPPTQLG